MAQWSSQPSKTILRGQQDLSKATFIFFSNFPWRDDMPCAGSFLFRPTKLAERVLRQWWDFHLTEKNFKHFHEQDALWHMLEASSTYNFLLSDSHKEGPIYSIVSEQQFPSAHTRFEELWLVHLASYNYGLRIPVLSQFLRILRRTSHDSFLDAVDMLAAHHMYNVDPLDIAEQMESCSIQEPDRVHNWPKHDLSQQSAWYDAHITSRGLSGLPLGVLHEGRLLRFKREFFIVQNAVKRPFASFDAYLQLRLVDELAISISRHEYNNLGVGEMIREGLDSADRAQLLRYYLPLQTGAISHSNAYYPLASEFVYRSQHSRRKEHGNSGRECILDSELQQLIYGHHNGTAIQPHAGGEKALMYILGHSAEALNIAKAYAHCKERYIKLLSIPSTPFFESIVYDTLLPEILTTLIHSSAQGGYKVKHVILGTYKTVGKSLHYNAFTQSLTQLRYLLRIAQASDYDVLPFLRSGSAFLPFAAHFHGPPFQRAWDALLLALGHNQSTIRAFDQHKQIFFRNIFIIKPYVLKSLCIYMQRALLISRTDETVKALLAADSKYQEGDVAVARRIFNTNYYQLHPFIFERLPSFFLHVMGVKVCHHDAGPCRANS